MRFRVPLLIRRSLVRAQVEEPEHMQKANLYRLAFLFAGLAMNGTFLVVKRRQRVVRPIIIVNRALPRGNKTGTTHRIIE